MIPHFDFGGGGAPLHFLHANGYPPDCYNPLLDLLKAHYCVFGMKLRPLWPNSKPEEINDWRPFSDDLLRFLDSTSALTAHSANEPHPERSRSAVIGVGHSIGGIVTLRAALREPQRFKALILLDPVLFPPYFIAVWNLARQFKLSHRMIPMVAGALKRRREFDNLDLIFRGYRSRNIFRYFSDENLKTYIAGITRPKAGGGYELVFSPEWESRIYLTGVWPDMELWRGLKKLEAPTLIIRGAETDTFWEDAARLVKRKQPRIQIEAVGQSTHLLPLERPQEVFDVMQSFLNQI